MSGIARPRTWPYLINDPLDRAGPRVRSLKPDHFLEIAGMSEERKPRHTKLGIILVASAFVMAPIPIELFVANGYVRRLSLIALGLGFVTWIPRDWRER
jgi:hypothetical protein